jgi:hypothetical protein
VDAHFGAPVNDKRSNRLSGEYTKVTAGFAMFGIVAMLNIATIPNIARPHAARSRKGERTMKKIVVTGIMCGMCAAMAAAQAGYKNFTFGMTAAQVQKITPDAREFEPRGGTIPGIYTLLMYLYNAEVGSLWASPSVPEMRYAETLYSSEKEDMVFAFAGNALYGIEVHGLPEGILADLKAHYGGKKIITLNDYDDILIDTAVWNDGKRFIVYCRYSDYTTKHYYRTAVFYYDVHFVKPIIEKAMQRKTR